MFWSKLVAFRERIDLRVQLALIVGALCLVVVLFTSFTAAQVAREQGVAQAEISLSAVAGGLAERLDNRMFERFREIRNIAGFAPVRSMWEGDPATIRSVLDQIQSSFPDYAWIGFAKLDGTVVAATKGMLEGMSVAERPWFIAGQKQASALDLHDAKLLSELMGSSPDGQPFRFVDVAVPVRNAEGTVIGVLGAHLSWAFAQATKRAILVNLPPTRQIDIWILNSAGQVINGPDFGSTPFTPEQLDDLKGGATLHDGEAGRFVSAAATKGYLDYPGLGWITVAVRPEAAALANSEALEGAIIRVGMVVAAAGAMVLAVVAGFLLRPLSTLAAEVDRIGRDQHTTVTRIGGSHDLVQLSSAIRALLRRLGLAENETEAARKAAADAALRMEENTRRLDHDINTLRQLADSDPLTGLLNRRAFNAFAQDGFQHFARYKRGLSMFIIDIDHFKRVNDTFGHQAGDEVIRAIGAKISGAIRTTDKAARFGGEEFVVMLREVDPAMAHKLAERIRCSIGETPVLHAGSPIHVTVSIGMAVITPTDRDIDDVIERADRALYRAKAKGRNRVVAYWTDEDQSKAA